MINFNFTRPSDENPEGVLNISVDYNAMEYYNEKQFPLYLTHKTIMGEVAWSSNLYPGYFSQYLMNTYTNVDIIDSLGNKLFEWIWNPFIHGDYAHQYFEIWALNNRGSNGIAIGTHNGMTGEWVGPVINGKLKATLVEASEPQFTDLLKFYGGKSMNIEVSHGEIVDKLTILQIKKENITDPIKLDNIVKEYDYLLSVVENDLGISTESPEYLELLSINKELWVIEDDIRDKERIKEFDDDFIKLARAVYYTNDVRAKIKKEINLKYSSGFVEEKSYQSY
jgi:hypothetical protein